MPEESRTPALRYIGAVGRLCFHSLAYCLHPLTDDYTYVVKARAWADMKAYSQAIRCLQKALRESEMAFVRAEMAWCYGELGMTEQALIHYRLAYARNKHPKIAVSLAWTEFHLDHIEESRALIEAIRQSSKPMDNEETASLEELERYMATTNAVTRNR